jgi:hypothetical protein
LARLGLGFLLSDVCGFGGVFNIRFRTSSRRFGAEFFGMTVQYSEEVRRAIEQATATHHAHARAIGELCISWAALDHAIDELLEPLLNRDRQIIACISSSLDKLGPRVEISKRLIVHEGLSEQWQDWFSDIFSRITDEIAPLRNRYVHDRWRMKRGEMLRIDSRAVVKRVQAHQPKTLVLDAVHVTPVDEVDRLRANVETVTYAINIASYDLSCWRKTGQLRPLRTQLIPASKPRSRMDRFPVMIVWNGEQLPAYGYVTDP